MASEKNDTQNEDFKEYEGYTTEKLRLLKFNFEHTLKTLPKVVAELTEEGGADEDVAEFKESIVKYRNSVKAIEELLQRRGDDGAIAGHGG